MSRLMKRPAPAIPLNANRCLVCRSLQLARNPISYSLCDWVWLDDPRTGPFCGLTCMHTFENWPMDRRMIAIFGSVPRALYLAFLLESGRIKTGA